MKLQRSKSVPGSAVQRFGNWHKREPQVLLDNQKWLDLGKPDEVEVYFGGKFSENPTFDELDDELELIY